MNNIKVFEDLLKKIDETRNYMDDMIKEKSNLLDPEIIVVSQMLDSILNEYYKIASKEIDE
jgi:Spo0E like sporulation regulatory protein.